MVGRGSAFGSIAYHEDKAPHRRVALKSVVKPAFWCLSQKNKNGAESSGTFVSACPPAPLLPRRTLQHSTAMHCTARMLSLDGLCLGLLFLGWALVVWQRAWLGARNVQGISRYRARYSRTRTNGGTIFYGNWSHQLRI